MHDSNSENKYTIQTERTSLHIKTEQRYIHDLNFFLYLAYCYCSDVVTSCDLRWTEALVVIFHNSIIKILECSMCIHLQTRVIIKSNRDILCCARVTTLLVLPWYRKTICHVTKVYIRTCTHISQYIDLAVTFSENLCGYILQPNTTHVLYCYTAKIRGWYHLKTL